MRRLHMLLTPLSVILILSGCGGGGTGSGVIGLCLTAADLDGPAVPMTVGQTADLALDENPSTGFTWDRSWTPRSALRVLQESYVPDRPGVAGSGGVKHIVFQALQPGTVVVTLQLSRGGSEPLDPHTLTLEIHDGKVLP